MTQNINIFLELKPYLFSIAYRITGSYQDTEDILQESYLRWIRVDKNKIQNQKHYLGTIVARLSLDLLKKASRRKETYIGPYLPEPIPEKLNEYEDQKIDFAFLVLLETLNPVERAVFILREAFGFEYETISQIVNKTHANSRRIFQRAKKAIQNRQKKFTPDPKIKSKLLTEFLFACYRNDTKNLTRLLKEDVVSYSDGGGKVHAARIPIPGLDRVLTLLKQTTKKISPKMNFYFCEANGQKSIVGYLDGQPKIFQTLLFENDKICEIYNILNPDKLKGFQNLEQLQKNSFLQKANFLYFVRFYWQRILTKIN
ncbi:sigma-70 family RNA polymerase sigma factor [Leptospira sp. 96542]|nr:sigma-70 family RNA polymerase sigma factor [Leptospira sp. 96542]